jgi:hypothetical protein
MSPANGGNGGYKVGDVLRYSSASKETGMGKGEYTQVSNIDAPTNRLTDGCRPSSPAIVHHCRRWQSRTVPSIAGILGESGRGGSPNAGILHGCPRLPN